MAVLLALASVAAVAGEVFFQEKFEGDSREPHHPPLSQRQRDMVCCDAPMHLAWMCTSCGSNECSACELVGVSLFGSVGFKRFGGGV